MARTQAAAGGFDVEFLVGQAANLPLRDRSVDAIVSVFGVIFAPDEVAAVAEMARVLRPGGRIVLSAWLREGALFEQAKLRRQLVAGVLGESPDLQLFAWHDRDALAQLFAPYGFFLSVSDEAIAFTATSPTAYADLDLAEHPLWVEARDVLEPAGLWSDVRRDLVRIFADANEDPEGFRITSRYVVATASR